MLLPAAEAMAAGGPLDVRLDVEAGGFVLEMNGVEAAADDLAERLRAALRSLFGQRAGMWAEGRGLTITLSQPVLVRTA